VLLVNDSLAGLLVNPLIWLLTSLLNSLQVGLPINSSLPVIL
jgi:hypothetical protein